MNKNDKNSAVFIFPTSFAELPIPHSMIDTVLMRSTEVHNCHAIAQVLCCTEAHKGHPLKFQWKFRFYSMKISILRWNFNSILPIFYHSTYYRPFSKCMRYAASA